MYKVVDSNYLRIPELREYFKKSINNFAVITDYASMEAYKGDTLITIYKSMEILAEFPRQVIILKNTRKVCGLYGRNAGLQRRLIDEGQTKDFHQYCKYLQLAKTGNQGAISSILEHGAVANQHMDKMLRELCDLPSIFKNMVSDYTPEELNIIRTRSSYTKEILDKIIKNTMLVSADLFSKHPNVKRIPNYVELLNTFIFRSSLCYHLYFLRWVYEGKHSIIKAEKIRNDMVDLNFATYALYFDGILTKDSKPMEIYTEAKIILGILREGL